MLYPTAIYAKTISDAWFQLLYGIFNGSYRQDIQKGSFENAQYRLQYPGIALFIEYPDQDMIPHIPPDLNIPSPITKEFVDDYFAHYIMDPDLAVNETYKYASRIKEPITYMKGNMERTVDTTQLQVVIDMLRATPLTNQAVLEIAKPDDIVTCVGNDGKLDPPCLRLIDFKVVPMKSDIKDDPDHPVKMVLTVTVYFRSWDLWAGFPVNLGGIELLKQYVAGETGLINGPMYAYSSGLHIYGYQEKFARVRTMQAARVGI
jgi:thymidylate synthase